MLKRHTLCYLDENGIRTLWTNLESAFPNRRTVRQMHRRCPHIPEIVCRERGVSTSVTVGLSFPVFCNGSRCRAASSVPVEAARIRQITPQQILELGVEGSAELSIPLREVRELAVQAHVRVGMFGSAALAVATGLSYVHAGSDLDLVVYPEPGADLPLFAHGLDQLQKRAERAVDAELYLGDGYYGKLNEILAKPKSILIKGDRVPKLISYREVQNMLHGTGLKMK